MSRSFSRFSTSSEDDEISEINISPLIDVVFILLIFFIVTTVFVDETGLDIEKPRAASQQQLEKDSIFIGVSAAGEIHYDGQPIPLDSVQSIVTRLQAERQRPVIIQADAAAATEVTVSVLDEAKLAGAKQVFVATENR